MLDSMRRGYTRGEFVEKIAEVRALMPDAGITTDIIVGYPGETEADFAATYELLRGAALRQSARGRLFAPARHHRVPQDGGRCPAEVKAERLHRVEEIEERISLEINEPYLGTLQPVLIEGIKGDQPFGRTTTGKLVHLDSPARIG